VLRHKNISVRALKDAVRRDLALDRHVPGQISSNGLGLIGTVEHGALL